MNWQVAKLWQRGGVTLVDNRYTLNHPPILHTDWWDLICHVLYKLDSSPSLYHQFRWQKEPLYLVRA
jgi:hypothetical protein